MSTTTYPRRTFKTGRPLGMRDVFSKIAENSLQVIGAAARGLFSRRGASRDRRIVEEAAALRRLADRQARISPAFASDLYAAADRHELIG